MSSQNIQKQVHLKKSSFEFEQTQENIEQNLESKDDFEKVEQKEQQKLQQQRNLNLLDLDAQQDKYNIQQYKQFLKDRVISIEGPQLITQNVFKSYKLYKIKSRRKNSQQYDTCVSRRFSDFQYLQQKLIQEYGGYIIPLLPEKNFWANINWQGQKFVKQRVKSLQKYLRNLLSHQRLRMTEQVRNFLFFDELKFSQGKGDFFSKIKTEDRVKTLASSAYKYGMGIYSKYVQGKKQIEQEFPKINKPNLQDLKLMQYQQDVDGLIKVINILQDIVQNSVQQMNIITELQQRHKRSGDVKPYYEKIKINFQDVSQYIKSCHDALHRRNFVRIQMQNLQEQLQGLQKKAKTNPRSQQIDIIRNKQARAVERCEKWTKQLLEELQKSVAVGKSMVEDFVNSYTKQKQKFYNS